MSVLLDGLNERQREAITAGLGPVLVLAGPGSGKTRVLTHRIAYLIGEMRVPPEAIMAVTFTNKAAGEMRARVETLLGGRMRGLQIGTFHAICARMLRKEGERTPYGPDYVIYDTDDQVAVVTQALAELGIDTKKWSPRRVLGAISTAKNELILPSDYKSLDYFTEVVARAYPRYQAILLDSNAMDFDDLLMQMVVLLRESAAVLEKYQRRMEYLLVDEFQDTNTAQYVLVQMLAKPQDNVFVVGDEDQGIYAFRGADYRNVLHFRKDYPNAQVILLEQNYRSTQMVLDAARAIIDKNTNRTPKALFTDRTGGTRVTLYEAYDETFESRYIADTIHELRDEHGLDWADFAVMYRTNAQSRALEEVCIREGIPYRLVGGVGFYKRREIRDLLAYLRVVNNINDKISFQRIINVPRRGIGKQSEADFYQWAAQECENYGDALMRLVNGEVSRLSGRAARLFADFGLMLFRWQEIAAGGDLVGLLDAIMGDIGYFKYVREDISDTPEQATEREENIQELRGLMARSMAEGISLSEFLAEQSLVSDVDEIAEDADSVTLLTLHAAKGLEFPVVFITGLEDGLLPHMRSFDDVDSMAEERRLMYVGVTRAKDHLYLTYTFRRTMFGSSATSVPSRFLFDIPQSLVDGISPKLQAESDIRRFQEQTEWDTPAFRMPNHAVRSKIVPFPGSPTRPGTAFKSNDIVNHKVFGRGRVIESKLDGGLEVVSVVFENRKHGIKQIDGSFLERV